MRQILLRDHNTTHKDPIRLARLTRHLHARLLDFGPNGPAVQSVDETTGTITALFPNKNATALVTQLENNFGILVAEEGEFLRFSLSCDMRFEDLDYVWGCFFELE